MAESKSSIDKTDEKVAPTPPNAEKIPDFVAAGHGNQVLDNQTRTENSPVPHKQDDLKAGAQPDGSASISERRLQNEDVERPDAYTSDYWREHERTSVE